MLYASDMLGDACALREGDPPTALLRVLRNELDKPRTGLHEERPCEPAAVRSDYDRAAEAQVEL